MRVNYFDLGLYRGVEMGWVVNSIFPNLGITDYRVYGFEACKVYAENLSRVYEKNDKVEILHNAVCDSEKKIKLYYSPNMLGHSIFSTKNNVSENKFEEVQGIVFSKWLSDNNIDLTNSLNIMKVNIEGAEWHLFKDLVDSGVNKDIHIFCGAGHDVEKIGELKDYIDEYYKLLADNNIHLHRFSEWKPHTNADIVSLIRKEYSLKEKAI